MKFPWTKEIERLKGQVALQNQAMAKMFEVVSNAGSGISSHRWDNPWLYATPHTTKRHPKALTTLETLQQFANTYDVLRSCINHLKREVQSIPFEIVSRNPNADKSVQIAEAGEFFSRTGGLGGMRVRTRHFENQIFEDVLTVGAYAVYIHPTRGGRPYEAIAIDSTTIRPVVDLLGWQNPLEAYEQQIQGVPLRRFSMDELYYDGLDPVTNSPYFRSPVEYLLGTIISALKADEWNRAWLTDGNTADSLISVPETWTPEQVLSYSAYFDSILAGNTSERVKTKIVPSGTKMIQSQTRHEADFQEFEKWLMQRTCSIMGVQPASIGYASEQYKVSQEGSMTATTQFGVGALLTLRKELYDDLLDALGYSDLEVKNRPDGEEDPDKKASRLVQQVGGPYKTVNEARGEDGLDPIEGGDIIPSLKRPDPEEDQDDDAPEEEKRVVDLRKWQTKAIAKLKKGKPAQVEFRSNFIDSQLNSTLWNELADCTTSEQVTQLFNSHL